MPKQRRLESGKEAAQAVEWTAQRRLEAQVEDKGESGEASAEIESGGRRNEIADETIRQAVSGSRKVETTA